jgi:polyprenyl-phospho-N-acetylgalactosaminyl synthase
MTSDTAIIIPVYNEGQVIRGVLETTLKHFRHVICVNDGSNDNSAQEIEKTAATLINHPINMGQGAALQTGIEFARELPDLQYFVTFDADGQHHIEDAEAMVKKLRSGNYDIVLGSRFLGSAMNIKKSKALLLKLAVKFSNITSGVKLTDTHNGLRAFNRHVAETLQITMPDMAHASEILEIISERKYRYVEVPVTIEYSEYSVSKGQTFFNAINIGFDIILRKFTR